MDSMNVEKNDDKGEIAGAADGAGESINASIAEMMKRNNKRTLWWGISIGVGVTALILTAATIVILIMQSNHFKRQFNDYVSSTVNSASSATSSTNNGSIIDSELTDKLDYMYSIIDSKFLFEEDIDMDEIKENTYRSLMDSLDDPYSCYYSAEELLDLFTESEGVYYGIGSYVMMNETYNLPVLSAIFKESPARNAGLRDGDIVFKVDGDETTGLTLDEVVSLIKGPDQTVVNLTIIREGESDYLEIPVTRGKCETPTVEYEMRDNDIGYLQITEFDDVTYTQFCNAYQDLQDQGMKGLILDLRSNPGGNLETVVKICGEILPEGIITYTLDKYGNRVDYKSKGKSPIEIPMVVLVNDFSASASELMTGAIRDYKKGTIMGTNTYGKGIVQEIATLPDGSGLKLTVERYYTPNGECFHGYGIAPDIEVEFDSELYYSDAAIDNQIVAAEEYLLDELSH